PAACRHCTSRRRHARPKRDWSSDVCPSDLTLSAAAPRRICELLAQQHPQLHITDTTDDQQTLDGGKTEQKEEHGWYLETRAQSPIWRGGTVRFDGQRLQWQAP